MEQTTFNPQHAPVSVEVSRFTGSGGVSEFHIMARPKERANIRQQLRWLHLAYTTLLRELGLQLSSAVLRRFFCSNLVNQVPALRASEWGPTGDNPELCALSWTDQPPAAPAKVALWAYHVADPAGSLQRERDAR